MVNMHLNIEPVLFKETGIAAKRVVLGSSCVQSHVRSMTDCGLRALIVFVSWLTRSKYLKEATWVESWCWGMSFCML